MIKTVYNVNLFPLIEWLRQNLEFEELEFPSKYNVLETHGNLS